MRTPNFTHDIDAIIVDEAHTITLWGGDFRKQYAQLEKLRSCVRLDVPLFVTSATLTPTVLDEIQSTLDFRPDKTAILNLGTTDTKA
jgi:superfamily II DNA helicase RecQ